jgi:hypothetical protein
MASSQMMRQTVQSMFACLLFLLIWQQDWSSSVSTGMENIEWAVCPPGRRSMAMPNEATQRTIQPFARMRWHNVR